MLRIVPACVVKVTLVWCGYDAAVANPWLCHESAIGSPHRLSVASKQRYRMETGSQSESASRKSMLPLTGSASVRTTLTGLLRR